jgi:hypothetical protein
MNYTDTQIKEELIKVLSSYSEEELPTSEIEKLDENIQKAILENRKRRDK